MLSGLETGLERLGHPVTLELKALEVETGAGYHDEALRRLERLAVSAVRPETWLARKANLLEQVGRDAEALAAHRATLEAIRRLTPAKRSVPAIAELEGQALERIHRIEDLR